MRHYHSYRIKKIFCSSLISAGATALVGWGGPVWALDFNFGDTSGLSPEYVDGLNAAADNWSAVFTDDFSVNVNVAAQSFQSNTLGSFQPRRVNVSYGSFVNGLSSQAVKTPDDKVALDFLPESWDFDLLLNPEFDLLINGTQNHPSGQPGDLTPYVDADGDCNNRSIRLTTANARAIGLPSGGTSNCASSAPQFVANDGTLLFNTNISWDFDPSDGIDADKYDFVGLATQGLGVIMGMVSGVDTLDFNTTPINDPMPRSFNDSTLSFVSPVDLFRFSEDSLTLGATTNTQSLIDWTTGRLDDDGQEVDKYFSIDGGQTKIASFSTGIQFGDGNRASSWKADDLTGNYLGIFEATPSQGQHLFITENDRRLLDVAGGWDLDPSFWAVNPPPTGGGNPPPTGGGNPPPTGGGNPPPTGGGNPPPDSVAVPEPGHAVGAGLLLVIALGRFAKKRSHS